MGSIRRNPGKPSGDCVASVHVWHDSHSGFLFQTWDAPRLAGGIYDEQCAVKPSASLLQHGAWGDGNGSTADFLHSMRDFCRTGGALCLWEEAVLLL